MRSDHSSVQKAGEPASRADVAYQHVIAHIEQHGAAEGDRLPSESEFADRLGLSRTSIREALARLRAEGRAVSRRGSGTFVVRAVKPELVRLSAIDSIRDLIEWHEFRVALESETAALSAERRSADELRHMHDAQAALLRQLAASQAEREDAAFHHAIAVGARNTKLIEAVGALTSHIFRWAALTSARGPLTRSERREVIAVEHGAILAAIEAGDSDQARAAVRRHLLNGRARLLSTLPR